ncbi:MAG: hypothetical protein ACI9YE_003173, partial [Psychroserpens sp.]
NNCSNGCLMIQKTLVNDLFAINLMFIRQINLTIW